MDPYVCALPVLIFWPFTVADPGFPVGGGRGPRRGAVDPQSGYVSKILHVKTKESGPVGGGAGRAPLDPPMLQTSASCRRERPILAAYLCDLFPGRSCHMYLENSRLVKFIQFTLLGFFHSQNNLCEKLQSVRSLSYQTCTINILVKHLKQ